MKKKAPAPAPPDDPAGGDPPALGDSLALCREVLGRYGVKNSDAAWASWSRKALRVKAALGKAIDPATWRLVIPLDGPEAGPEARRGRILTSLRDFGLDDGLFPTGFPSAAEVESGLVAEDRQGLLVPGMALGRALAAWLAKYWEGRTVDDVIRGDVNQGLLKLIFRLRSNRARKGLPPSGLTTKAVIDALVGEVMGGAVAKAAYVALSANPLDLLTMSEHAAYTSCHALKEGSAARAGPLQYVADGHTAVLFCFRESRQYNPAGRKLPYKVWRRLVHFDREHRSAALVRHYPGSKALPAGGDVVCRALVLGVLLRLLGLKRDPGHTFRHANGPVVVQGDCRVAYVDPPVEHKGEFLILKGGAAPLLDLAAKTPCPGCARGGLTEGGKLTCPACRGEKMIRCKYCRKAICKDHDAYYFVDNDPKVPACPRCWAKHFFQCDGCYQARPVAQRVEFNGRPCCQDCLKGALPCASCGEKSLSRSLRALADRKYCGVCFRRDFVGCDSCGCSVAKGDVKRGNGGMGGYSFCPGCHAHRWPPPRKKAKEEVAPAPAGGFAVGVRVTASGLLYRGEAVVVDSRRPGHVSVRVPDGRHAPDGRRVISYSQADVEAGLIRPL